MYVCILKLIHASNISIIKLGSFSAKKYIAFYNLLFLYGKNCFSSHSVFLSRIIFFFHIILKGYILFAAL